MVPERRTDGKTDKNIPAPMAENNSTNKIMTLTLNPV